MWWSLYFGSSYFFYLPSYLSILIDSIMHTLPLIFYDTNGFANHLDFYSFFNHFPLPQTPLFRRVESTLLKIFYLPDSYILNLLLSSLSMAVLPRVEPTSMEAFICFGSDGFTVYKFLRIKHSYVFSEHVLHILKLHKYFCYLILLSSEQLSCAESVFFWQKIICIFLREFLHICLIFLPFSRENSYIYLNI